MMTGLVTASAQDAAAGAGPSRPPPQRPARIQPPQPPPGPPPDSPPRLPSAGGLEAFTLRFQDPALEGLYLRDRAHTLWRVVDRATFYACFAILFASTLARGGSRPACHALLASSLLAFLGHAAAVAVLQAHPQHLETHRTHLIALVRLSYAASFAAFNTACREPEYRACAPAPAFALRSFVVDTGLVALLFQAFAMPLPYRAHAAVGAATVAVFWMLHNPQACAALGSPTFAACIHAALRQRPRLTARWLPLVARPFMPWPTQPGGAHACWSGMLLSQVVAGLVLPSCALYVLEEAARRRFAAGWHGRPQQQPQGQRRQQQEPHWRPH